MKNLLLAGTAAIFALSAAPAWAQDAEEVASNGDIVVTATRSETLLSKTPITMTAIGGEGLRDAGITDARSIADSVPNIAITENSDAVRISIRGVTSSDTTEKGDPSAAFLLDGVYIARPSDVMGSFYDVERVEVLRGPQGTLYGRNTTAGVVNVIAARPVGEFRASVDGGYGNLGTVDATAMVNVPVGEGLGVRAAVNYQEQDAYFRIDGAPVVPINPFRKVLSGRLSFGGEIGNLSFVVRGDWSKTKGTGVNGNTVPLSNFFPGALTPTVDPLYVDLGNRQQRLLSPSPTVPSRRNNENWGVMGEFTYDFGPAQLTYLGSHRETDRNDVRNLLLFGSLNNPAIFFGDFKQDSHELRLAFGNDNALHGQLGAYYFKEKSALEFNLGNPLSGLVVPGATGFAFPQGPTVARSKAAFGQLTYDITEDLHVTAGIRHTQDFKSRDGATVVDFATVASSICGQLRCVLNENIAKRKFKKTTWKVGVDYDAPGFGLIFASVSTGYKAGGFNDGCVTGSGIGCGLTADALYFNPELLTSYEAGFKARIGPAVRLNASIYHYDYSDLQVSRVVTVPIPATLIQNAAKAKVDGFEIEFTAQLGPNDKFDATYAYTNARYSFFVPDPANFPNFSFKGRQLDHAPKHTVLAGYTHTFPLGNGGDIKASLRTKFSSAYFMQDLNILAQFHQPDFTKTDATVTYSAPGERWYLQGYVKNIENRITLGAASSGLAATAVIMEPRTYGVRAGFKF